MLARIELNIADAALDPFAFMVTMQNVSTENVCVVTGPDTYLFLKLSEDFQSFEKFHS